MDWDGHNEGNVPSTERRLAAVKGEKTLVELTKKSPVLTGDRVSQCILITGPMLWMGRQLIALVLGDLG